ncbi:DUF1837 domain-containing protein [Exiguobacterium sp. s143]|uniref:HamA C-terminal domain-containing protein n=1 Tax=Exiguobacterium sp. s143 TaxID=2751201 RepID=UPI001BE8B21F|nr:DUF1837 domain-containing protein [Exiguobacterium sp. s143]
MIQTTADKKFKDIFYHELSSTIENNKVNLFVTQIQNNKFNYFRLMNGLISNIIPFCLSPKEIEEINNSGLSYVNAVSRLKEYENNSGELGEILLYNFLEIDLNAPKLLTKMKLKTSSKDYVKGADGIHLLKKNELDYELIFGESKMRTNFKDGIYDALTSIKAYINREVNNINHEVNLVNSNLIGEVFNEQQFKVLKDILIPSKNESNIDYSFGIFIGFEICFSEEELKLNNSNFRIIIREKIKDLVQKELQYLQKKIIEFDLTSYNFYLYCVPFTDLDTTRKRMIKNLKEAKNDF